MLMRPGFKAYETGVRHAFLAAQYLGTPPNSNSSPNKKLKTSMPPVSRTSNYKKSNARKMVTKSKKSATTSAVKKTILGMAASYHNTQNDSSLIVSALHSTIYSSNLTAKISQGTSNIGRQGDQIFIMGCRFKGNYFTAATANAYQFRILVGWSGEEYNPSQFGTSSGGTGLTAPEIFLPSTGSNFGTTAVVNRKAFTVLYDATVDSNSQVAGAVDVTHLERYIPINQKFAYQTLASQYGKTKNLYIVCIASLAGGTLDTTASGVISFNTEVIFKNL